MAVALLQQTLALLADQSYLIADCNMAVALLELLAVELLVVSGSVLLERGL